MKLAGERDAGKSGDRKSPSRSARVKLADFGISWSQASKWMMLARMATGQRPSLEAPCRVETQDLAVNEAACQVIDIARVGCFDESQVIHAMLLRVH